MKNNFSENLEKWIKDTSVIKININSFKSMLRDKKWIKDTSVIRTNINEFIFVLKDRRKK